MSEKNPESEFVDQLSGGRYFHPVSLTLDLDTLAVDYKGWEGHDRMEGSIELLTMLPYAITELRVARDLIVAMKQEKREQDEYHSLCRKVVQEALGGDQQSDEHWEFADFAKDIQAVRHERDKYKLDVDEFGKKRCHKIINQYEELASIFVAPASPVSTHATIMEVARKMKSRAEIGDLHISGK